MEVFMRDVNKLEDWPFIFFVHRDYDRKFRMRDQSNYINTWSPE